MTPRCSARSSCALTAALLLAVACSGAAPRPPAATGQAPRRIISLVPAVTEMLFAIGADPQIVAVSSFDHYPPAVEKLPRVGGLLDPDLERILALRPDLVVVYGAQSDLGARLADAGIRTFPYTLGGLANATTTIRRLGEATGHRQDAERVAAAVASGLEEVRARIAGLPRPRTLLVFGRDPGSLHNVDASGGVGFLHDLVELGGGTNVFAGIGRESVRATTEGILAAAPEVIIELHYSGDLTMERMARERRVWNALPSLPAVQQGRIVLLVGDEFVVPGMRVVDAARQIARAIHPEVGF